LGASRRTIQACAAAIRAVHRAEFDAAEARIAEAASLLGEADAEVAAHPDVRHGGYLHDAKKEFAEANLTLAFVRGDPLPTPQALRVEIPAYLNGMAEAASELRRNLLDCLRAGRLERAEGLLGVMDDVYGLLVTIDYPDALTGGLRRTTDALRAVIERSRGDLTTTIVASRLQNRIDDLRHDTGV
jgi:translin